MNYSVLVICGATPVRVCRAIVDTMLGAIALVSGSRTMESYMADMTTRGQSEDRKNQVTDAARS